MPYLLVGMVATLALRAVERSPAQPLLPSWPIIGRNSLILALASLTLIYVLVHLRAA